MSCMLLIGIMMNDVLYFSHRYFYVSNLHPIWSGCYGKEISRARTLEDLIKYLEKEGVLNYVG